MTSHGPEDPGAVPPRGRTGRPTGPPARPTFDEQGLRSLGDEVARDPAAAAAGVRGHRRLWWVLGGLGTLLALVVAGTAGYAWYLNGEIHRLDVKGLVDVPTTGADAGTENILLVGSTDRCALKVQNAAYGLCSNGVTGVNSDVVMILHLDPAKHRLSILSVPRDLFVPNARTEGANKIDAALYEGPSQLVSAINDNLGIPIQHYVVLNFDTFANVVDALGGREDVLPGAGVRRLLRASRSSRRAAWSSTGSTPSRWSAPVTSSTRRPAPRRPTPTTGPSRTRAIWPGSAATTSSSASWPPPCRRTGCPTPSPTSGSSARWPPSSRWTSSSPPRTW